MANKGNSRLVTSTTAEDEQLEVFASHRVIAGPLLMADG
jgi:hypothetical protein